MELRAVEEKYEEQKSQTKFKVFVYGGLAVMAIMSGRLDATALLMRVFCVLAAAWIMKMANPEAFAGMRMPF